MNKLVLIVFFWAMGLVVMAQSVQISRQVISTTGTSGSGSYFLDYTVGQPEFSTGISSSYALTQGFQQPGFKDDLLVDWLIEQPGCTNDGLGSIGIISISGCGGTISEVLVNGEETELPISGLEPGAYTITVNAGFNCSFEEEITLEESNELCDLQFYNIITPNNDGLNDEWIIEHIRDYNNGENTVLIINRWGQEVYSVENYGDEDSLWQGRDQEGKELSDGTYFYFVTVGNFDFTGYIELLR